MAEILHCKHGEILLSGGVFVIISLLIELLFSKGASFLKDASYGYVVCSHESRVCPVDESGMLRHTINEV